MPVPGEEKKIERGVKMQEWERYILKLLRHKSSERTEIYTHASNKNIGKIKTLSGGLQIKSGEDD